MAGRFFWLCPNPLAYRKNKDWFGILSPFSTTSYNHIKVLECRLHVFFGDPSLIVKFFCIRKFLLSHNILKIDWLVYFSRNFDILFCLIRVIRILIYRSIGSKLSKCKKNNRPILMANGRGQIHPLLPLRSVSRSYKEK